MEVQIIPDQSQVLPKDLFVSVRLGAIKKQARFSGSQTLKFPDPGDCDDGSQFVGRVEILQRVGFASVDFSKSCGQLQSFSIECGALDSSPLKLQMALSCNAPLDETLKSASEQKVRKRLDEAQRYMREHQLDNLLSESLRECIRERPKNPHCFLSAELVKRGAQLPPLSSPASPMASRIKVDSTLNPSKQLPKSGAANSPEAMVIEARQVVNQAYHGAHKRLGSKDPAYLEFRQDDYFSKSGGEQIERNCCTFTYIGDMEGGSRVGEGVQVFPNGSKYEGQWSNDQAGGQGKFTHADGATYEGEWLNGKANGEGTFTHVNGNSYKGQWKDDKKDGSGVQHWIDGAKYKGEFRTDSISGKGRFSWGDGSCYSGEFADHAIHGEGTYSWSDGRQYCGQWLKNQMHGKGLFTWTDGRSFEGEYKNDQRHGAGILKWSDGRFYEGSWKEGIEHGAGVYTLASGQKCSGHWIGGVWNWD
mmetsp:Transcript_87970/g.138885  ORF Transcript_87970/g.138885 Transcript_87970/m.138885 type:complete len:475 (+) Transcript_87970:75-1499(+)|eukprot:CAMPEP_0169112354 /NCGR_PEP_ID=MMETSP1015-20121227/27595_1 /TAXON_ID=342587 /ORGANISM="Karlodinium micrum, Strain CCMP2283" /LENGTH=474 /DNA_ID=CAMNT_0009174395 /DNA_START=37 /DNA_END=1461 /DNA_ORIENTATION=-